MTAVVLASASPRRHELLARMGLRFEVRAADVDESPLAGESPVDYVRRVAAAKAAAVARAPGELLIAADTTVDVDGTILAKPVDEQDAASMLRRLSSRTHRVHTGVVVQHDDVEVADVCTTLVAFGVLDEALIRWYLSTGEAMGKAGAYALQGAGAVLVRGVRGSVTNVIGLPLHVVVELAGRAGVDLLAEASNA